MALKTSHRVFFAIPFDSTTKEMYGDIASRLKERYNVTSVFGNMEISPSPEYSEIVSFKAQNSDLVTQIKSEIEKADVIVADLTQNNPNVHVELGIGLYLNKNILRVTGRSLTELGFDIRNFEVYQFKDKQDLFDKICKYLDLFFKIKNLPLSSDAGPVYTYAPGSVDLAATENNAPYNVIPRFQMRDGCIRVNFEFRNQRSDEDWFGMYFRFGESPFIGGYLVHVRKNGWMEVVVYPGPKLLEKRLLVPGGIASAKTLLVEVEGDCMRGVMDGQILETCTLKIQNKGNVAFGTWWSKVTYWDVHAVCRDTIDF